MLDLHDGKYNIVGVLCSLSKFYQFLRLTFSLKVGDGLTTVTRGRDGLYLV